MLTFTDYDSYNEHEDDDVKLPKVVNSIRVSHDGGRLSITVNNEKVFYATSGTRDCCIEITN